MHNLSEPLTFPEKTMSQLFDQNIEEYIVTGFWHNLSGIVPKAQTKIDERGYYKISHHFLKMGVVQDDVI